MFLYMCVWRILIYVLVIIVVRDCVEYDVGWVGKGAGCDGVGVGAAMMDVCVDDCDSDVACVRLSICVVDVFSLCLSVLLLFLYFLV